MAGKLTELESCTLGVIRQNQPCSTYEVRQVFARSPTPAWSGSTGAVYPVVRRLLKLGLLRAEKAPGDRRGRTTLTLTDDGQRALLDWITSIEPWAARPTPDPIRTRAAFLDLLTSPSQRAQFFALAQSRTADAIEDLRADARQDPPEDVTGLGALYELEARLKWLQAARGKLAELEAKTPDDQIVQAT
jgi:DNA-binding PadR family transcriptional regulator